MQGLGLRNVNGVLPVTSLKTLDEIARKEAAAANTKPFVQALAGHVRSCFDAAEEARDDAEQRMLKSLRQRRGEYEPTKLADIRKMGGSEIYMMLTSNKCRAAAAWMRDTLLGQRDEKPWTIEPTAVPELTEEDMARLRNEATQEVMQIEAMAMAPITPDRVRQVALRIRDEALARMQDEAKATMSRMEQKMEDQLQEGGFMHALSAFIDDLTTFPSAIMKGPVIRKKKRMKWDKGNLVVTEDLTVNWERVDPFMAYPAPHSAGVEDGYFIERHRLTRQDINAMMGVPGYNDNALRAVLDEYGRGGLNQWLSIDTERADAEGKNTLHIVKQPEVTIDALQFWGSVQGSMLTEWGMETEEDIDPAKDYDCEVWLIGSWVVKATLNPDPLGRKPYYKTSYEEIPGVFWGNSVSDLVRDCQDMCNAAARALSDNMGISSGPQVWVNNDRLADGEAVTQMYPWKIWQTKSDPYGTNTAPPVDFFQPNSNANELMAIYERFSVLADEFSGVPRYMTGDANVGGAGRTASGMSMLMGNAGKTIKQVMNNIDIHVLSQLIERQYYHNMRFSEDPDLKGDVRVVARGVNALVAKEQLQVRRNEFTQLALTNPIVAQIVGEEAIAELLRETAKTLDMNTGKIIPSAEKIRARQAMLQMQQAAMMGMPGQAPAQQTMPQNGQALENGAPVTDNFQPMRA